MSAELRARRCFGSFLNKLELCGTGVELGVFEGEFAEQILSTWKGERLILVDAWRHLPAYLDSWNLPDEMMFKNYKKTVRRMARFGDRVQIVRASGRDAAHHIPDESLDFVYIDANHAYSAVISDLYDWYPKVRPGGILSGHDYFDARADAELEPMRWDAATYHKDELTSYGVKSAVDEFVGNLKVTLEVTPEEFPTWLFVKPISTIVEPIARS